MHMADALISPVVGSVMMVTTAGTIGYSIKKISNELDEKKIPLMGVMGAFIFAAQMINFSIPGTGSSGHIGGGLLLAAVLGPYAGFLTIASVLMIQALLFGDGGLLAYGCNVFNMGFFTCFIAYPFIFKMIMYKGFTTKKIFWASMISSVIALQMGAFSVVLETVFSGKTQLPFETFILFMQVIHLAIAVVEGLITAVIVNFIWKSKPEIIEMSTTSENIGNISIKKVVINFTILVFITGGLLSSFASSNPDGLEWAIFKTTGDTEIEVSSEIHETFSNIQNKIVVLPDYDFKTDESEINEEKQENSNISISAGTSFSGIIGGMITLLLAIIIGFSISFLKRKRIRI